MLNRLSAFFLFFEIKDPLKKGRQSQVNPLFSLYHLTRHIERMSRPILFAYEGSNVLTNNTLGRNWRKLKLKQKKEFLGLFKQTTHAVCIWTKVMSCTDGKVVYEKESMFFREEG